MALDPTLLQAGELRIPITITAPSSTRDAFGQPVNTWNTVLTTRAKVESTTGLAYKERIQNNVISSEATHLVTMRWPGSSVQIATGMRVLFNDKALLIQAVDNVLERNRVVRLICQEIDGVVN